MEFDHFTVALLLLRLDAPQLDDEAADALQDAHLSHLAQLHEAGHLIAAGPVSDPAGRLRGLSVLRVDLEQARSLCEQDPAVRAGRFEIDVFPWTVPAGALAFSATRFPHAVAEVMGG